MNKQYVLKFFSRFYELSDLYGTDWIKGEVETPLKKLNVFFKFFNGKIFLMSANNYISNSYLCNVLCSINYAITNNFINKSSVLSICPIGIFDNVLVINPNDHEWFNSFNIQIHNITNWCIPINHCEYAPDKKYLNYFLRRNDVVNWDRSISPFIKIRLNDPRKKIKVTKKYAFYTSENMLNDICDLREKDSWIEISNYKYDKVIIEYMPTQLKYKITGDDICLMIDLDEIKIFTIDFITK